MALYPRAFVQRLREELAVSEVVGKRVPLKRKGREWEACCPFHQEKTPSFTVNDQKGFYHCFGCSAHGDALKFLMEFERLSYPEAIEALAREAGMALPTPSPELEKQEKRRQNLTDIMERAADWFAEQLQLSGGTQARDYLQRRGVTADSIKNFRIGYAPDERQALKRHLLKQGAEEAQLVAAGLAIQPDSGESYDRFRGRIMFPILDAGGEVIAFGGRTLKKDDKAKYLNSPETELFHKGQVLYNWKRARAQVSDDRPLLVAEGYMDVIALHQAGFAQAVAPLGTALTEQHLQKLWQACDAPVLCLDGDSAGQRAMWRSAELALPHLQPGKTLKFCVLPQGQDPDDFLKNQGAAAFRKLLDGAESLSQVMLAHMRRETGEETPEQRAALEAALEGLAQRIKHAGLQQHFRRYFREKLWAKPGRRQAQAHARVKQLAAVDGRRSGLEMLERQLLRAVLCQPALLEEAVVEEALAGLHCRHAELAAIQRWLLESWHALPEPEDWPQAVIALQQDKAIPLSPVFAAAEPDPLLLRQAWEELLEAHHVTQIQRDIDGLKRELEAEWTPERQEKLELLKAQILALQSRRYADS